MERLIDKLNKYQSLHTEILKAFGTNGWYSIESHVGNRWHNNDSEIQWLDESGTEYAYDHAIQIGDEVEGYKLFSIRDNGDTFYAMFSTSLREKDYDSYSEQVGVEI